MRELAKADRGGVAVARDAEIDEIAVGEVGAGEYRRHAAVDGVESVRGVEEVVRRLRRAANSGNLRNPMRLDRELKARLDDRSRDRIVAATRAERRNLAFVI